MHGQIAGEESISDELIDYEYRKEFNLSYEDFMNEPVKVFKSNLTIMALKRQNEARQQRAGQRMNKIGK